MLALSLGFVLHLFFLYFCRKIKLTMATPKIGDTVRFLNSVGGGRVVRIEGQIAYVDEDGFETPALLRECVVVAAGESFYERSYKPSSPTPAPKPDSVKPAPAPQPQPELPPVRETPEGEKINLVIGFEPADIKRLSDTSFDAFVVNDSNFCLYLTVATRPNESDKWTLRYGGMIEPAMQEFMFELLPEDLPSIDRIAVRAIPFKRSGDFTMKPAINFEQRLDATKFARLHCFGTNPYFDSQVLAIDVVKDDEVQVPRKVDPEQLRRAMQEKERDDRRKTRPVAKVSKSSKASTALLEIDLHAAELLDDLRGLSPADILNYQIDTFRKVMDENLCNIGREIVFIHGKGEGVLRGALMKELNHRYKGHDVADASFREYGFGATKVTIRKIK